MRQTYLDRRWPDVPVFQEIARRWCADQSRMLLDLVWRGYDRLQEDLVKVPFSADDEAKEESLNFMLAVRVNQCSTGHEPFWFLPQPPETAKRKRGRGSSPTPDHGFALYENPRSIWPVEGKVLNDERDLTAYTSEIRGNFLTGRYAAFSREGAMLGYLLDGDPIATLEHIGVRLKVRMDTHPRFPERPHRMSVHRRRVTRQRPPDEFRCHHLILMIPTS